MEPVGTSPMSVALEALSARIQRRRRKSGCSTPKVEMMRGRKRRSWFSYAFWCLERLAEKRCVSASPCHVPM